MTLRASSLTLLDWIYQTTKTVIPRCREDICLTDTFRHDPPPTRWNRKSTQAPRIGRHWKLLAAFAALNQVVSHASVSFQLFTELEATNRLRKIQITPG